MGDQIILKHINEAVQNIRAVTLDEMEIELRLNRHLDQATFKQLEQRLAGGKWESVADSVVTDRVVGDARITDGTRAIRKRRITMTDAGMYRVVTSQEQPTAVPLATAAHTLERVKHRRERMFWGWKLSTTVVNPGSPTPGYECELELHTPDLVRRPYNLLAAVGAKIMDDVVQMVMDP